MDLVTKQCNPCYDGCFTCKDETDKTCTACTRNWWFHSLRCAQSCPDKFYKNNFT
jgi:hypothetical protein